MSLKRLCETPAEASELVFNTLGGTVLLVVAFLRLISWTSFSISNLDIVFNETFSWFTMISLISKIPGWNLYLVIDFSIGSEISISGLIESGLII